MGALSFGLLAVGLDMTVLNVALPTLAADLQATTSDLQWFADSYNLVLAALLLPAGMLGDRYGRKKWLLVSLLLFGAASLGCAFSETTGMLIGMRALLGLGAAFLLPLSISVLPVLFPDTENRTKAMTIWAMTNMLGIPLGPIIGGWMLKHYDWGSIFLLNLPLVAIALFAVSALMPESRSEIRRRIDVPGIVSSSAGLIGITFGVIRAGEYGWDDSVALITLLAGLVLAALFVLRQSRVTDPLIDLSLFRSGSFTWGTLLATLVTFAIFGLLFALPQFFQAVRGADTLTTGLRMLPLIAGLIAGARVSGRLLSSAGAKIAAALGFAIMAAGLFAGSGTTAASGYGYAALWITVTGIGLGFALPASMASASNELSAERSGVGSALIMAMRQVGGAIGVALLGSAMNYGYRIKLHLDGLPDAAAETVRHGPTAGAAVARQLQSPALLDNVQFSFVHGMDILLVLCGGIAVLGAVLAFAFLPRQTAASQSKEMAI